MDLPLCVTLTCLILTHSNTGDINSIMTRQYGEIHNLSPYMNTKTSICTENTKAGTLPPQLKLLIIATPSCTSAHLTSVQHWESARLLLHFYTTWADKALDKAATAGTYLSKQRLALQTNLRNVLWLT